MIIAPFSNMYGGDDLSMMRAIMRGDKDDCQLVHDGHPSSGLRKYRLRRKKRNKAASKARRR